jgi:hypothetical protein
MKKILLFFRLGRGIDSYRQTKYRSHSLILLFFSIIFCSLMLSCKKEEVDDKLSIPVADYDIVNLTINGKKYAESKVPNIQFSRDNQVMCDTKKGTEQNIGVGTLDSRFEVYMDLIHKSINADFKNSKPGAYSISDYSNIFFYLKNDTGPCNLHLYIYILDNGKKLTFNSGSHGISKITFLKTGSLYSEYLIEGQFATNFINSDKVITPVTGTYKKVIQVFNQ